MRAPPPILLLAVCAVLFSVWAEGIAYSDGVCPKSLYGTYRKMPVSGIMLAENRNLIEKTRKNPNRLFVNPEGLLDSAGVPTIADIQEFFEQHPDEMLDMIQNPGQWPYLAVATGIIAGRDMVKIEGGRPIPAHLRKILRRWYPDDLMDSVRWTTVRGAVRQYLQEARMNFESDTLAVTLIDVVIFRNDKLAEDGTLWAHELYHVQQYRRWGVFGFARKWVENASITGPIEAPAYARQSEAQPFFKQR